jgi:hypothetical protein
LWLCIADGKVKVKQSHYRLGQSLGFQEVEAPTFVDNLHMKVVRSALHTGLLYSFTRKYSWYSFLLEAASTPEPLRGWKDYVNEKF